MSLQDNNRKIAELEEKIKQLSNENAFYKVFMNELTYKENNAENGEYYGITDKNEENEKHLRLLIDNAPDAIFIQTDWKFAYLNQQALKLFGADSPAQLLGMHVIDRFHPDFRDSVKVKLRELNEKRNSQPRVEETIIKLDGTFVNAEVSAVPFKYFGKNGALVFAQDITERKQFEDKLKDSYNLLNNLTAQVPGVVYQYRLYPDGKSAFPYSSPGMYDIYEVTSEEVREDASTVFTRIHPDDYDYIVEAINESARNQTVFHTEFRVILPKQGLRWRHCDAKPELLPDGSTLWHGIITDITERKKIEDEINRSNELLESFFNCTIDLLCIADVHGNFIRLNKEWENVLGYNISELEGSRFLDFVHPEDIEATKQTISQLTNQETIINFINRYRCKNGEYKWIEWKSYPSGNTIYAAARDITERKNSQEALIQKNNELGASEVRIRSANEKLLSTLESLKEKENKLLVINKELEQSIQKHKELEERLEFALNSSNTGAWDLDLGDHSAIRTLQHDKIFGYNTLLDKWTYEMFLEHVIESDRGLVDQKFRHAIENNTLWDFQCRIKRVDGDIRWIWAIGKHLINKNNHSHRIAGIVQDITDRKKSEIELIAAKEKAEESNRLKVAFLQNMSHEIRTPMNAIIGFSEMLRNHSLSHEKRSQYADIIIKSTNQLLSVVTDIITISSLETKQETANISVINVNNIVNHLFSVFKPKTDELNLRLIEKKGLTNDDSSIFTDGSKVTQILTNLISNSLKFTSNGFIEFGYERKDSIIEFYVKDTGIGIDASLHEKIFERFRQAELTISRRYGGTGLGLSISKGLAELIGGRIRVQSQPGNGSTFYLAIPYRPVEKILKDEPENTFSKKLFTLLIAEDEELNYYLIEEILLDYNLKLIHAKDGDEAVKICEKNAKIDLVLMDIKMPKMDGYTATKMIKKQRPDLPIIAQTAYGLENEIEIYQDIFDAYITKPINKEKLKIKINEFLKI